MQPEIWEQWPCVLFSRPPSRLWRSRRRHGGRAQQKICWTWVDFEGNQEKFHQGPEFLGLQNQWSPTLSIFQRSILVLLDSYEGFAQCSAKCWCHGYIAISSLTLVVYPTVIYFHIFHNFQTYPKMSIGSIKSSWPKQLNATCSRERSHHRVLLRSGPACRMQMRWTSELKGIARYKVVYANKQVCLS